MCSDLLEWPEPIHDGMERGTSRKNSDRSHCGMGDLRGLDEVELPGVLDPAEAARTRQAGHGPAVAEVAPAEHDVLDRILAPFGEAQGVPAAHSRGAVVGASVDPRDTAGIL